MSPPRARTLTAAVVEDLTARITKGTYRPGDRLPSELEVMAEQGVSRTVVREAMSRLQAAGLAETRHGIGTFVLAAQGTTPGARGAGSSLDPRTVVTLKDVIAMLELRISFEAEAAALAAARRTKAQLARIEGAVAALDDVIAGGGDAIEADYRLHVEIALATGNRYFEEIFNYLGTATIPRTRLNTASIHAEPLADYLRRINGEHHAIVDAIVRREPDAARAAMRLHLSNSRERLRQAAQEQARRGGR